MTVLIVERDELIADVLATALEEEGIEAAILDDDKIALEACEPEAPQVVITGINRIRMTWRDCSWCARCANGAHC